MRSKASPAWTPLEDPCARTLCESTWVDLTRVCRLQSVFRLKGTWKRLTNRCVCVYACPSLFCKASAPIHISSVLSTPPVGLYTVCFGPARAFLCPSGWKAGHQAVEELVTHLVKNLTKRLGNFQTLAPKSVVSYHMWAPLKNWKKH